MKITSMCIQAGTALALLGVSPGASADYYLFQMEGDFNATWTISSPVVPTGFEVGFGFRFWDLPGGTFQGQQSQVVDMYFTRLIPTFTCGGIHIDDFRAGRTLVSTCGPTLYQGVESQPTFLTGTFELTTWPGDIGHHSLTITFVSEVPEPQSAALLLAGAALLVGVGVARRLGDA